MAVRVWEVVVWRLSCEVRDLKGLKELSCCEDSRGPFKSRGKEVGCMSMRLWGWNKSS